jgi:hypothetical protein
MSGPAKGSSHNSPLESKIIGKLETSFSFEEGWFIDWFSTLKSIRSDNKSVDEGVAGVAKWMLKNLNLEVNKNVINKFKLFN